ncbi:cytochrome c biogenesis protein CcsA [Terrilactibacillus sp. S3-3]|nr:cytochrome c biogenesis protein CcsA [Terrilactibacillus sp. S3-3]
MTPADGLLFLSWLLVFSSLFAKCLTKKAAIIFFADTIGFALMALDFFKRGGRMTGWNAPPLLSDDLIVHIIIAFLAYALFTLSFIFSIIYTIEYQLLKRKKLYRHLMKFGSLETMDGWIFWADLIGVSLLLISLAIGSLWASTGSFDFFAGLIRK